MAICFPLLIKIDITKKDCASGYPKMHSLNLSSPQDTQQIRQYMPAIQQAIRQL